MKYFITVTFLLLNLSAIDNTTCIEKLNQLNKLKSQKASGVENTAAFILSGGMVNFFKNKNKEELAQKIRVLEMELKSCRGKNIN